MSDDKSDSTPEWFDGDEKDIYERKGVKNTVDVSERLLGDDRATRATETVERPYASATNPEAFHAALADGDLERAADHSSLTVEEFCEKVDVLRFAGEGLAADSPDVTTTDKDEFVWSTSPGDLGSVSSPVVVWCLPAKYGVEALACRRRGEIDDVAEERARFTAYFFCFISPAS